MRGAGEASGDSSTVAETFEEIAAWVTAQQRAARESGDGVVDIAHAAPHPAQPLVACTISRRDSPDAELSRHIVTVDAAGAVRRVHDADEDTAWPVWSPDGERLCVLTAQKSEPATVVVSDREGGTAPVRATGLAGSVEMARWSPDGERLALVVADPDADVSDVWGSGTVGGGSAESWRPQVFPHHGGRRRLVVWEPASGSHRRPTELNVWEVDWCGADLIAVVSDGAGEDDWYAARLVRVGADDEVTTLYEATHQLARPRGAPDGRTWSVLTGLASDRDLLAGGLVVGGPDRAAEAVDAAGADVTDQRWIADDTILFIGQRGLDTVVASVCLGGTCTERWSGRATTGVYQPQLGGVGSDGELVLVIEQHDQPPRLVRMRADGHDGDHGDDVLLDSQGPGTDHVVRTTGATHEISWTSPDGWSMQGFLTLPDRDGPHPLVVHVHGGPVYAYQDGWIGRDVHTTILAARGYAVFRPNPRGSSGRGAPFAQAVLGDMGGMDVADIVSGIDQLVADGVVDPDRIGITGQSYGGFMAAWIPCLTDRFAASVSRSPCTDWRSQHLTSNIAEFDRLFLEGAPFDATSQYQERSPLVHHERCRTPMLLTAGRFDLATPTNQAQQMYKALEEQGVAAALAIYPEEGHGVQALPALADQCARMIAWFERFMPAT